MLSFIWSRRRSIPLNAAMLMLSVANVFMFCSGCSKSGERKTTAVYGTVKYKGAPVAGANVFFVPENGPRAIGDTDAGGRFTLMTYSRGDGAVPGQFKVGISKFVQDPATKSDPVPGMKNELPEKYNNPTESGLSATVEVGKKNDFVFDLQE